MCKSRSFQSPEGQDSEVLGDHSHCVLLVKAVTGLASQRGGIDLGRVMNNLQILFLLYGTQYAQHVPQALLHGSFLVQCSSRTGYIASVSAELPGSNAPKFRCFQETLILVAGCPVIDGLRGPSLVLLRIFFEGLR